MLIAEIAESVRSGAIRASQAVFPRAPVDVPVAASAAGLPNGVQVIGRRGHESEVLGVARAIEIQAGTIAR